MQLLRQLEMPVWTTLVCLLIASGVSVVTADRSLLPFHLADEAVISPPPKRTPQVAADLCDCCLRYRLAACCEWCVAPAPTKPTQPPLDHVETRLNNLRRASCKCCKRTTTRACCSTCFMLGGSK
ncbi:hypothetical protein NP493_549g01025 [Ridgeia piscesae]|uniref:Hepcidin n=1 Tax=Ridgeia piscesae TaxID=27915 RepID=A0AAD9NPT4_RIDPI|nr:hypothetical protein NP493_549g01025 [Ridgeia piscesae]